MESTVRSILEDYPSVSDFENIFDLNTTDTGVWYHVAGSETVTTLEPYEATAKLRVYTSNNLVVQRLVGYNGVSIVRYMGSSGTWTSWYTPFDSISLDEIKHEDFNNIKTKGYYRIHTSQNANAPSVHAGILIVTSSETTVAQWYYGIEFNAYGRFSYDGGATWGSWHTFDHNKKDLMTFRDEQYRDSWPANYEHDLWYLTDSKFNQEVWFNNVFSYETYKRKQGTLNYDNITTTGTYHILGNSNQLVYPYDPPKAELYSVPPSPTHGTLQVRNQDNTVIQFFSNESDFRMIREKKNNTWTPWLVFPFGNNLQSPDNVTDLNNIIEGEFWVDKTTLKNLPVKEKGLLNVFASTETPPDKITVMIPLIQRYTTVTLKIYARARYNGHWLSWVRAA